MLVPTDLVENHMSNAKCFSFLMFPTKKLNEHQSIVTSPYQNLNSVPQNHVSEAVCPFAAGTSCLKS